MSDVLNILPWIAIGLGLAYLLLRGRGFMFGAAGKGGTPAPGADDERLARETERIEAEIAALRVVRAPNFRGPCPGDEDHVSLSIDVDVAEPRKPPPKVVRQRTTDSAPVLRGSKARNYMPEIVTGIVLLSALYVILSRGYGDAEQKWAYGVIGTVVGHWLKK